MREGGRHDLNLRQSRSMLALSPLMVGVAGRKVPRYKLSVITTPVQPVQLLKAVGLST